ncbi:MAG: HesA/MoeB/ThiF family protein [Proteobacteria bacterium]|nr:HesA/MoeB/ThiF family protein [Desulfobacula sp.]MBU3951936.1 HesA/MoeB/ThiF family protein [Pseudomonadota bacterium]MBU4129725.1 HesA/MoeB/ThiF family protein [Pseudomonadota bacterium]
MDQHQRYDRNFNTFSLKDQEILARSHVAIIGLGGLGGGVCEMLARTGIGTLTLVDGDRFDISNLNRQLLCREDLVGTSKAMAAKDRVKAINSSVRVNHWEVAADESNLHRMIEAADLVVDCLDTIESRFLLQAMARKASIPLVSGAIAGVFGQLTVIFPGDPGYELIYGENKASHPRGIETHTGNISYCALLVAAIQASECVKVLLNRGDILRNKLLIVDLWSNSFDVMELV